MKVIRVKNAHQRRDMKITGLPVFGCWLVQEVELEDDICLHKTPTPESNMNTDGTRARRSQAHFLNRKREGILHMQDSALQSLCKIHF